MTSNARERKNDWMARQIETAKLIVSQYDELLATIRDPYTRELTQRHRAFWLDVLERRQAEMRGGERQALRVKT